MIILQIAIQILPVISMCLFLYYAVCSIRSNSFNNNDGMFRYYHVRWKVSLLITFVLGSIKYFYNSYFI